MQLDHTLSRLTGASHRLLANQTQRFIRLTAKLDALSPLKVLSRGFTMATLDEEIIYSVDQLSPGDQVRLRFIDGDALSEIQEVNYG